MKTEAELIAEARAAASRVGLGHVLALRASGASAELDATTRDELLGRAVRGEYVELELDVLAYEQKAGERNRNAVRFRDGAMAALGRSGKGKPFLRDHKQGDVTARGGTILASAAVKVAEGHHQIRQSVKLTDPAAVARALRGLMGSVSIGWNPTGPILCSACGTPVLERGSCWHWPGDEIKLEGGASTVVVEWIYTSAELLEASEVSVPGVPSAAIEGVRAALSAALNRGGQRPPQEHDEMKNLPAFVALLGLAATAGEDDILPAVEALKKRGDALEAQNATFVAAQAKITAEQVAASAQLAAKELEDFIAGGVKAGKLAAGSQMETSLRAYHAVDKAGAVALLASMPQIVPVGQERQSDKPAPQPKLGLSVAGAADRISAASGGRASLEGVRSNLLAAGKSPTEADAIIARQLAPKGA